MTKIKITPKKFSEAFLRKNSIMKYNPDIIKSNRKTVSIEIRPDGKLTVRAPVRMSYREIEKFVNSKSEWIEKTLAKVNSRQSTDITPYTQEELESFVKLAKEIIPPRVKYYADILNVEYNGITIRTPKTRWGSCSSKKNLSFSALLTQMPEEIMDSVIVHELCHLKQMNHSKKFYDEILKIMPDYRQREKWLKENGIKYMQRLG